MHLGRQVLLHLHWLPWGKPYLIILQKPVGCWSSSHFGNMCMHMYLPKNHCFWKIAVGVIVLRAGLVLQGTCTAFLHGLLCY